MQDISIFKDKFTGQTASLVATGPSSLKLEAKHIGDSNLVMAINSAIRKVRTLKCLVPVFTIQKDAGKGTVYLPYHAPLRCIECDYKCLHVKPEPAEILLLHKHESPDCSPEYPERYLFDNHQFGLKWYNCSAMSAVNILKYFGVTRIKMISFDALTEQNVYASYDGVTVDRPYTAGYLEQNAITLSTLKSCGFQDKDVEWITPGKTNEHSE